MARINTAEELMNRVVEMLPKNIPAEAIEEVEIDNWDLYGRYWVYLKAGWMFDERHTIHENSLDEIKRCLKSVQRKEDDWKLDEERDKRILSWLEERENGTI